MHEFDLNEAFEAARQAGLLPNIHGVVVARAGEIAFERYLVGTDAARGRPLGVVRFGPHTLHDMRSVTKSIVGLLYGIALEQERAPKPDVKLIDEFPEYPDLASDPGRQALTVRHALTMTLGTEWDELTIPYTDPRNSEIAMDNAPDPYRYVLERPIKESPGIRWVYNGGASALLGRIITKRTGKKLDEFAREVLFEPLGISAFEWIENRNGDPIAASGLRITPRDLARIGVMILNDGRHGGRQIVPKGWLKTAFEPAVAMPDGRQYGYQWYLSTLIRNDGGRIRSEPAISAMGNGGQRLFVLPKLDLVFAVTAGNYDSLEQWRPPTMLVRDVLLPAILTNQADD